MAVRWLRIVVVLSAMATAIIASLLTQPISDGVYLLLFGRPGTQSCVPADELGHGPAAPARAITAEEIEQFRLDGSVLLRGVLDQAWQKRLLALNEDVFTSPNLWDVVYTRALANFYCAQKSIFLHHTSKCGREIAEAGPTTQIAATLLGSSTLRVAEPTEALGNFRTAGDTLPDNPTVPPWRKMSVVGGTLDGCGSTAWHRDDKYFALKRRRPERPAVARFWIPLVPFTPEHLSFAALNISAGSVAERLARGFDIQGTDFGLHARFEAARARGMFAGHVIDGGPQGYAPGDVFAFSEETPHLAQAGPSPCSTASNCLRLILSFAGDNAVVVAGRNTGFIPLQENQTVGEPPQGAQYPQVYPAFDTEGWEWDLRPTWLQLVRSAGWSASAGVGGFMGADAGVAASYLRRVGTFAASGTILGVWDAPTGGGDGFTTLNLWDHFGFE